MEDKKANATTDINKTHWLEQNHDPYIKLAMTA